MTSSINNTARKRMMNHNKVYSPFVVLNTFDKVIKQNKQRKPTPHNRRLVTRSKIAPVMKNIKSNTSGPIRKLNKRENLLIKGCCSLNFFCLRFQNIL